MKSPAFKKTPVGKQKTPNAPKSGKKSFGPAASPKIGKTPPTAMMKGNKNTPVNSRKATPVKAAFKGKKGGPQQKKLADLSESDVDSDDDFGLDGEEFGPLSDDSSSDVDEEDQVSIPKKGQKTAKMEVDDDDDEEDDDDEDDSDDAPALVSSKPVVAQKTPLKGQTTPQKAAKTNGQKSPSGDMTKSIYVGNLPPGATEDQVQKLFVDCGEIESVKLVKDPKTQVSRGYGFVDFADAASVATALKKQGVKLNNKVLKIGNRGKDTKKTETNVEVDRSKGVYVGNMPFTYVTEENIRQLFADCGDITSVVIPRNAQGNPKGSAVVNFGENDSVAKALRKTGTPIEGRELAVRLAIDTSRTVSVEHIKPIKGGIFAAAKCLKELLGDLDDIASITLKKKADEFAASLNFESTDSAKKAVVKNGSKIGQGVVAVELAEFAKPKKDWPPQQQQGKKPKMDRQFGQGKPNFKKPFNNKGGNNQKKPFQGAGSPPKMQQQGQDKSAALKNKTQQKFQKKKEASNQKLRT